MKTHIRVIASSVAVCLALSTVSVRADWIGDFYSAAGSGSNVTMPQAISSQSVIGASGGGMSWRTPNKNFQPFSITPPSLKAGCNGIDIYLGAYSFPNKAAFVNALRNFGQASIGFFFQLALNSMSPEIKGTLDVINDLANKMNQMGMNTCAEASKMVNSVAGEWAKGKTEETSAQRVVDGDNEDQLAAKEEVKTNWLMQTITDYKAKFGKAKAAVVAGDLPRFDPVEMNVLWYAIKNADINGLGDDEAEMMMSLIGPSLIYRGGVATDGTAAPDLGNMASPLTYKALMEPSPLGLANATDVIVLSCGGDVQCLTPASLSISFNSFFQRAHSAVEAIKANVAGRTTQNLTADQMIVLKLSTIPLYRAAAMAASGGVGGAVAEELLPKMAEFAAVDAGGRLVTYYLDLVDRSLLRVSPRIPEKGRPEVVAMRDRIKVIKDDMRANAKDFYMSHGNPYEMLERLDKAEKYMSSNLSIQLAANARFSKR
jgi:conjugative transfer pilus assembly protein TraH